MFNVRSIFLLFLLALHNGFVISQDAPPDIEHWIQQLSVRKDPNFQHYRQVFLEIDAIDSLHYCTVIRQLQDRAQAENIYCRIRAGYLVRSAIDNEYFRCQFAEGPDTPPDPLHLAYSIADPFLIALGNRLYAGKYRVKGEFGLALMHLLLARELQDSLGTAHFFDVAFDRYALGELQYHARDYHGAIKSIHESLTFDQQGRKLGHDTLGPTNMMFLYNTLGLAYEKIGRYDSAFAAFDKALFWVQSANIFRQWTPMLKGNRGDLFFALGQYDSAAFLLRQDIDSSLAGGPRWADNAAASMHKLASILVKQHQPLAALDLLKKANRVLQQNPQPRIQASIYYGFMEAFEALDQTDSLSAYTRKYFSLHDSLERKANESQQAIVNVRLANQLSIDHLKSLQIEKRRIALIRNFIIVIAIFSFALGVLYINRQRLKMELQQQQAIEERTKSEAAAIAARRLLTIHTDYLLEKNALVENLQEQLASKQSDENQALTISALSQHTILNDEDWDQFKTLFEQVHPGFVDQLHGISPDITMAELRVAVLSRLHLTPKEAGILLGISPASVNKTRQRLRQRLNLDPSADLDKFFNSLQE